MDIETAIPFQDLVHSLCTRNKDDQKSLRTAAVASALVEVVQEKLEGTAASYEDVSPAGMFVSTLNALTSSITSDTVETLDQSPQSSLLEILAHIIPYVSTSNPNLYIHQFSSTSRVLRGIISSIPKPLHSGPDDQSSISVGWNALLRQSLRTSSIVLNGILILENTKHLEKEVLRCFHNTILQHFDDPRAKVRKQAHACATELLRLSLSISNEKQAFLRHVIPDQLVEYSHQIISQFVLQREKKMNNSKKFKENEVQTKAAIVQLLHLLSYLESAIPFLLLKCRLKVGQDLLKVYEVVLKDKDASQGENNLMIVSHSLAALLQIFDHTNREYIHDNERSSHEENSFCATAWSSLIQLNPSLVSCSKNFDERGSSCRVAFTNCVVAITLRLLNYDEGILSALSHKLLPLSLKSIINCIGDDDIGQDSAQSICAELGRVIRSPSFSSCVNGKGSMAVAECITIMQTLLQYRFSLFWDSALPLLASLAVVIVQAMIPSSNLNEESITEIKKMIDPILEGLVQLHKDSAGKSQQKAIESAVEIIVQGIGLEMFMSLLDITAKDIVSSERAWVLSVLTKALTNHTSPYSPRLSFFQSRVLGIARKCDSATSTSNITAATSSIYKSYVVDLWSLFPFFCLNPLDIEITFPTLAQTLVRAMTDKRYPQLLTIVCSGISALAYNIQNKQTFGDNQDEQTSNITKKDIEVFSEYSKKILPELFKLVENLNSVQSKSNIEDSGNMDLDNMNDVDDAKTLSQNSQQAVTVVNTIANLAPLVHKQFLEGLFKKILQRLLVASQSEYDQTEKICSLLGLAQALVKSQSLNEDSINLLYRSLKPLLRSDEHNARVQKRAYKVFSEICQYYTSFVIASSRLEEIIDLLIGSSIALEISARNMRLKCLSFIVEGLDNNNKQHMEVIPNVMGEVLLCLKDANSKTREAAYQLILVMSRVKEDMTEYFQIIVGALGAQTTHMRSAAVMALSRLVFEYAREDVSVQSLLPSLLQTVICLFDENSREVIKSVIGFVRVSVAALNKEQLEPLLPELVGGLMKYNRGKGRFRSKIKIILKRLVKAFGYEAITPLVPSSDTRLLNHMRKLSERAAKRKAANVGDAVTTVGEFDDLMDSDEDDSDGGRTLMTGVTGFTKLTGAVSRNSMKSAASIKSALMSKSGKSVSQSMLSTKSSSTMQARIDASGEKDGDVIDMLDPKMNKSVRFAQNYDEDSYGSVDDDDEAMEFDETGRLVVHQDDFSKATIRSDNRDNDSSDMNRNTKRMKMSKYESALAARDEDRAKKNQKTKVSALGSAYKSKKAGGDVKRKNQKFEPYAFVPLDGRNYTKKNRGKSVETMSTIVRQKSGSKRKRR